MGLSCPKVNIVFIQGCNICGKFEQEYYTRPMYSNHGFVLFVVSYSVNKEEFKISL